MPDKTFACDLHIHTNVSWCAAREMSPSAIAAAAKAAGLNTVGLADHLWLDPKRGTRPAIERLLGLKAREGWHPAFLLGAEADCAPGMGIAGAASLERLDFVLASYHFADIRQGKRRWPQSVDELARILAAGFESALDAPEASVVGHPFFVPPRIMNKLDPILRTRLADVYAKLRSLADPLFRRAAKRNVGLELNAKAVNLPGGRLLKPLLVTAKAAGCRFIIASDAHRLREIGSARSLAPFVRSLGIEEKDLWQYRDRPEADHGIA